MSARRPVPTAAALLVALCLAGEAAAQQPGPVERLGWMAGCWEAEARGVTVHEQWMRPAAGTMLGMGRTVRGDSTVAHEFMRLVERGGRVVLVVHPSGQAEAEFTATEASERALVLENPDHDFPQRIRYRRAGADSLPARIEGTAGGRERGIDFPFVRTACP